MGEMVVEKESMAAFNLLSTTNMSSRLLLALTCVHSLAFTTLAQAADQPLKPLWLMPLQALRDDGLEENTLIVFTSDHGEMNGAHQARLKTKFFEESAGVPFIVSLKGVTKPGLVDNQHLVSSGQDLIPTLCDFAGIQPPAGLLGRSIRSLAEGREVSEWRSYVVSETRGGRMLCSGRYKYCIYETGLRREQLVDLEKDPGEMKNLAADPAHADILALHRKYLLEWVENNHDQLAASYLIQ
jgi:arylsulfatase A-like enzyme